MVLCESSQSEHVAMHWQLVYYASAAGVNGALTEMCVPYISVIDANYTHTRSVVFVVPNEVQLLKST